MKDDLNISVTGPEQMIEAVRALGIVPFFSSRVPGWSIEALTPAECWIGQETLGPWDWKIDCVQAGDIAYGKFLDGGKAAFATGGWYRELMNWRRSQDKYKPSGMEKDACTFLCERGTCTTKELRAFLGVKKAQSEQVIAHLAMDTLLVIGDIKRLYQGPNLEYKGWQTIYLCRPEEILGSPQTTDDAPGWVRLFEKETGCVTEPQRSPRESWERLFEHIREIAPEATDAQIRKVLG